MTERPPAPDQGARQRILDELDATLFVEAGAGSGKTSALVDRLVALVTTGTAELRNVAAITFTDKAAAELRDRIRHRLETVAEHSAETVVGRRCRAGLDQLDGAAIGTLHAFAQRLLSENPVEAGLPPQVEVLDEVTSAIEFDRRWSAFQDRLLADTDVERPLQLLLAAGGKETALRGLALAFEDNWDLVEERIPAVAPAPPDTKELVAKALVAVHEVCAERQHCRTSADKLCQRLDEIADYACRLYAIDDELDLLEALPPAGKLKAPFNKLYGQGKNWSLDIDRLKERITAAGRELQGAAAAMAEGAAEQLGSAIRCFTLDGVRERRAAGRLEFHDLLVMARALLRHPEHGAVVRKRLSERYQRLLLDEFQDTDPIQIELAVRIASADPASDAAGTDPWTKVPVRPGRLFVVGDPKQSIYRFRRADISTFLTAAERFGHEAGGVVQLSANFRTVGPIIDWVNHTFGALMQPGANVPLPSQAPYVALQATRSPAPTGPSVAVVGRAEQPKGSADELRQAEARDVAATVVRALTEGWSINDPVEGWRPARLGDITILVPARTSLPFLEDALEQLGVPFRAESSSLVYATRAVRDLLMVLRAVDDPTDQLVIVGALRTPLYACGDDDLFRFRHERRGSWSFLADQPSTVPADDPVLQGLSHLRELHGSRQWSTPSELLDRIARDRRVFELGFVEGRPRDVWRRVRFVIDQARAWSEATGGSLRQYLAWVEQQTVDGARVAESVLPETDDDAVRIMTIHAAKGLEFPVTIVSGMTTKPQGNQWAARVVFPPDGSGVGYRLGSNIVTSEFERWKPIDEQMAFDERIRLLYVACTRARDHLVVSLYRAARSSEPDSAQLTNAELLLAGTGSWLDQLPDAVEPAGGTTPARSIPAGAPVAAPPPLDDWANELRVALERSRRPTAVAATALTDDGGPDVEREAGGVPGTSGARAARPVQSQLDLGPGHAARGAHLTDLDGDPSLPDPGLQKRPGDMDLPPWLKGRYGTAVGRAVHGVLQTIDLQTGEGRDAAIAAQCEAEAISDRADTVRQLVDHALASPSVCEAARSPHWRELYACTPVGPEGRLLEGYVDLLYRTNAGLVVVDYKTAGTADPDELSRRAEGYRLQGAAYAVAVSATSGEEVCRVVFVFLTPEGAVERELADLTDAMRDVGELVSAGAEVMVD